jgi:ADP-heptose:LPS heptosyltransferase
MEHVMRVGIHRSTRGIGDMIMMEPLFAMLCNKHDVQGVELYLPWEVMEVHRHHPLVTAIDRAWPRYERFPDPYPDLDHVYDLSDACFKYELANQPGITKGRTQIWAEACGLTYDGDPPPKLWLPGEDGVSAVKAKFTGPRTIAVGYGSKDEWRSYPHVDDLILELAKFARVWVFHDYEMPSLMERLPDGADVELFDSCNLRELFWRIKGCNLVVSPDTSFVHIAGALNVPAYGIFGPTDANIRMRDYLTQWRAPKPYRACRRAPCWYEACRGQYCLSTLHPKDLARDVRKFWGDIP